MRLRRFGVHAAAAGFTASMADPVASADTAPITSSRPNDRTFERREEGAP
jgi:hypothetical protein